ncbi:MAG: preprotein translocase subunit SecG [Pseudomonadota bacterium]
MENVVLIILLILAVSLIGVVLMQRSEGGGLGIGGGGGGGLVSGRSAANALTKLTWALGAAFMVASLVMTVIAAQNASGSSVVDRLGVAPSSGAEVPEVPAGELLLPPSADESSPLVPPAE